MRYQVTFNSGRAEYECDTFRDAMWFASCFREEFMIWETRTGEASKLIVHGWATCGINQ